MLIQMIPKLLTIASGAPAGGITLKSVGIALPVGDHMEVKAVDHLGQQGIGDGRSAGKGGPSRGPCMAKTKDHTGLHFGALMAGPDLRRRLS